VVYLNSEIRTDTATSSVVKVYSIYDVNRDDVVDARDLGIVQRYYMADSNSANWNAAKVCDFNNDNVVDILDIVDLYLHYTR
jgi:hypothetical protein